MLARAAEAALHAAQLLYVLARARVLASTAHGRQLAATWFDIIVRCRRAVSIIQHHDAITGTSRANVVKDYDGMLRDAATRAYGVAAAAAAQLLRRSGPESASDHNYDSTGVSGSDALMSPPRLAERLGRVFERSSGGSSRLEPTPLVVFNPLSAPRCEPIRLLMRSVSVSVSDAAGEPTGIGLLRAKDSSQSASEQQASSSKAMHRGSSVDGNAPPLQRKLEVLLDQLPSSTPSEATEGLPTHEVWAHICAPPLGLATYFVHSSSTSSAAEVETASPPVYWDDEHERSHPRLHGHCVDADVDSRSGMLRRLHIACDGATSAARPAYNPPRALGLKLGLFAYPTRKSGAYIMRTEGAAAPLKTRPANLAWHRTPLVHELQAHASNSFSVKTRIFQAPHGLSAGGDDGSAIHPMAIVEVELSVYAPRNQEVVLRLQTDVGSFGGIAPADTFLTHDGLAWRRRGNPPGEDEGPPSPAAAFFPTSVGAALRYPPADGTGSPPGQLFVLFDRSVGVARLAARGEHGDGSIELLLHRSLAQDDGRGLMGPVFDDSPSKLRLQLLWGVPSPQMLRAVDWRILALQAPMLPLRAQCPRDEPDGCTPADYAAHYGTSFQPVRTPPPFAMNVLPRPTNNDSAQMLLRVQRSCGAASCGDRSVVQALRQLFDPPLALDGLKEVGLSGGPMPPAGEDTPAARMAGLDSASSPDSASAAMVATEEHSQNSEEAGVFVSDAALQHATEEAQTDAHMAALKDIGGSVPRRRLLASSSHHEHAKAAVLPDFGDDAALEVRAFECTLRGDATAVASADSASSSITGHSPALALQPPLETTKLEQRYDAASSTLVLRRPTPHTSVPSLLLLPMSVSMLAALLLFACMRRRRRDTTSRASLSLPVVTDSTRAHTS